MHKDVWKAGDLGIINKSVEFWWVAECNVEHSKDIELLRDRIFLAPKIHLNLEGHLLEVICPVRYIVYAPGDRLYSIILSTNFTKL